MYLRKRLRRLPPGLFVDVGVGSGAVARALLDLGWRGVGWDLSEEALRRAAAVTAGRRFALRRGDWLASSEPEQADLVVASMLLEHLPEEDVDRFFGRAASVLAPSGRVVLFVPASPAHWGIEDETAGHLRRYTPSSLRSAVEGAGWRVLHLAGLTFPLSNLLLPLSNRQVKRWESERLARAPDHRTRQSGARTVPWKTTFPRVVRLVLNEVVLWPFHVAQQLASRSERSLVLYCECEPSGANAALERRADAVDHAKRVLLGEPGPKR